MRTLSRDEFVQRVRYVPRSPLGVLSVLGWVLSIVGVVLLIAGDFGRWNALGVTAAGVMVMCIAGYAIQRKFVADAKAAGFDGADIRAIENEAERLNEEED